MPKGKTPTNKRNKPQPVPINGNGNGNTLPRPPKHTDAMSAVRAGDSSVPVYPVPYEYEVTSKGKPTGKRRVGRPSKYKEEYCGMLIEHMSHGNPIETFAAKIHVTIDTVYEWVKVYPEFSEAKRIGTPKWLAWWLRMGTALVADDPSTQLELLGVKPFLKKETTTYYPEGKRGAEERTEVFKEFHVPRGQTSAYCYIMTNMFRHLGWRNDYRHEVTGPDGGPIQHEAKSIHLVANMTTEELRELDELHNRVAKRVLLQGSKETIEINPAEV